MNDHNSEGTAPQTATTKFMAAIFEDYERAAQGEQAILSLEREGTLSILGIAIVGRGPAGQLLVIKAPNGPSTEALTALLSKLSAALSRLPSQAYGVLSNLEGWGDLEDFGVTPNFIQALTTAFQPAKTAVIAEIEEDWITPLDLRIEEIGGQIMRTWRAELEAES